MLKTRVLSAVVLVLISGALLYYGGLLWWVLLLFISIVGYHEYCRALGGSASESDHAVTAPEALGHVCTLIYYSVLYFTPGRDHLLYAVLLTVLLFMITFVVLFPKYEFDNLARICFGFFYVPFMLSFLYSLRIREKGLKEILLVVIASWICDTFAYFTGMLLGRHKLSPELSPKKSIEGAVGGVVASALFGLLLAFVSNESLILYPLITGAGAVISQFGDLFASGIKRNHGIKDFGDIIPGHGGILDRFDSMIITAPVIYVLCSMFL